MSDDVAVSPKLKSASTAKTYTVRELISELLNMELDSEVAVSFRGSAPMQVVDVEYDGETEFVVLSC